tara:strand:+ start:4914 stop:6083 length:1170 start_codon:yes stop_codon:yes gene_type:complete
MAEFAHDPNTGQNYVYDTQSGGWRAAAPAEVGLMQNEALMTAAAVTEGATGLVGLAAPRIAGAAGIVSPGAETFGTALSLGAGGASLAMRGGRKRMADRLTEKAPGGTFKTKQGFVRRPSDMVPKPMRGSVAAMESGIEAIPLARVATDMMKMQRQKVMGGKVGKALGMTDDEIAASSGLLKPASIDPALTRIDETYDAARSFLSEKVSRGKVAKIAEEAKKAGVFTDKDIAAFTNAADNTGDQLLAIRSELRAMERNADNIIQKRRVHEVIDEIGGIISDATEGTEVSAALKQADIRYKVWKTLSESGAIGGEGQVNLSSLRNAMKTKFGARKIKGGGDLSKTDPGIADMIRAANELAELGPFMPSSGTAERAIAAGLISGSAGGAAF